MMVLVTKLDKKMRELTVSLGLTSSWLALTLSSFLSLLVPNTCFLRSLIPKWLHQPSLSLNFRGRKWERETRLKERSEAVTHKKKEPSHFTSSSPSVPLKHFNRAFHWILTVNFCWNRSICHCCWLEQRIQSLVVLNHQSLLPLNPVLEMISCVTWGTARKTSFLPFLCYFSYCWTIIINLIIILSTSLSFPTTSDLSLLFLSKSCCISVCLSRNHFICTTFSSSNSWIYFA